MKIAEQTVELLNYMGDDLTIVNAARVSFDKQSSYVWDDVYYEYTEELKDQDKKLINYLATHGHWSPFAHAFMSIRVKAPIFLARQLVKHQVGLSWNEVSRRYVDSEPEFWFPKEWRGRPVNAKQGSDGLVDRQEAWTELAHYSCSENLKDYLAAIESGVAPELARMFLPQNTMTEWIWSGSLMAFARIYNQRSDSHAQKEAQEFAEKLATVIPKCFEYSWKALTK